jgi:hypothetical protein
MACFRVNFKFILFFYAETLFMPDTFQHSANAVAELPGGDLKKFQNICRMSQIVFKPLITSYRIVTAFEERLLVRLMYVYKFTKQFY